MSKSRNRVPNQNAGWVWGQVVEHKMVRFGIHFEGIADKLDVGLVKERNQGKTEVTKRHLGMGKRAQQIQARAEDWDAKFQGQAHQTGK